MSKQNISKKIELVSLPKISDRVTFLYIEHAKLQRSNSSLTVLDSKGVVRIPSGMIGVLFLGPGTDVSHRAIELLGDMGTAIVWVGERGIRQYAHGRALARSTKLLENQAKFVSNSKLRIGVARKMYQLRFPNENVEKLTMQQLRGREGSRVRNIYKQMSRMHNVKWSKRVYDPDNFDSSDNVNKALSVANVALYGLVYSVVVALGLSTGLGFIHTGHDLSFVYDIADLYKSEMTIPIAFEIASSIVEGEDLPRKVRYRMRDSFVAGKIIERIVNDIQFLLNIKLEEELVIESLGLWDDKDKLVSYGVSYKEVA